MNRTELKIRLNIGFKLFISFTKIGLFMFGGGYAMLPLLERELIVNRKWVTADEILEILSVSQMTPGTIAINAATFVGNKKAGIIGGIMASVGIILPSLIIITLIYQLFGSNFDNIYIQKAFLGIRACLIALIANSVIKLFQSGIRGHVPVLVFSVAFILLLLKIHPILIIISGGVFGLIFWRVVPYILNKRSLEHEKFNK